MRTQLIAESWNPGLAAEYLDGREKAWFAWAPARSKGGPCLSCHTGLTYLLARPRLRTVLGQGGPGEYEQGLLDGLRARVNQEMGLGARAGQAMGVESIFAALLLARADGAEKMSPESVQAFARLWQFQKRNGPLRGAWDWYDFGVDPFETADSAYFGAALGALAVEETPRAYQDREDVRERVGELARYLAAGYERQPLHNRLMAAWAARRMPAAVPKGALAAIRKEALGKQAEDGSWAIESLGPWRAHAEAPPAEGVRGYATAFTAFVLRAAGVPASDRRMAKALGWLRAHQDREAGYWDAGSMNKRHEAGSMQDLFMRDAATGFAVLALTAAE